MSNKISFSFIFVVGLMLFALFFGAGNLIFPAMLGQSAGDEVWSANAGFLVTGVGLPLLGVLAFGFSGKQDLQSLASRVHPVFGVVFTTILYLAIGPLFAIPRTGSVSFEIGVKPFVGEGSSSIFLLLFTVVFFFITCFFSLFPAKIVDIVGKYLTPIMLIFIGILVTVAILHPMGNFEPSTEKYAEHSFFVGFQEGYLTMDTLASFVFGIIIINAFKERGIHSKRQLMKVSFLSAAIATIILALIYTSLSYIGATSVQPFGYLENGGIVLASVSNHYFGTLGSVLLGLIILLACLTTSVGLVTACSTYFHKLIPRISYKQIAISLSIFSAILANVGLAQLISFSVPVLSIIYPLAIVLIVLTFTHTIFKGRPEVYQASLALTFIISTVSGLQGTIVQVPFVHSLFTDYLPLYEKGLGWLLPALVGVVIGYVWSNLKQNNRKVTY